MERGVNSIESNKEIARQLITAINERDVATIEALVADNLVHHALEVDRTTECREFWWFNVQESLTAFPDLRLEIDDIVAEDDKVLCRITMRGTFTREFEGLAPTRKTAKTAGFHLLRFNDGQIVEWWRLSNMMGWSTQLELLPTTSRELARFTIRQWRWKLWGNKSQS